MVNFLVFIGTLLVWTFGFGLVHYWFVESEAPYALIVGTYVLLLLGVVGFIYLAAL